MQWIAFVLLFSVVPDENGLESVHATERSYRCTYTSQPPIIDGRLSDPQWNQSTPTGNMVQTFPDPGKSATYPTRIHVMYDKQAIYIAAHCSDPHPEQIVAKATRRDRQIESDWFQVEIDSQRDRKSGFFFAVNAAGVQFDGTLYNENQESTEWDGVWQTQTQIVENGWNVEMSIPLHLLRFQPSQDVRFGINFIRRISRLNEVQQWQYIDPNSGMRVARFGVLEHLDLSDDPISFTISPYLAGRLQTSNDAGTDRLRNFDAGVDARLGLGNNLMMTMTVNPDFGQVEADQVVFNLSTIETYFPEKRPFFLQDDTLFRKPYDMGDDGPRAELFYTRRIGLAQKQPLLGDGEELVERAPAPRIYAAGKLVGTTKDRLSIGVMQAVTSSEYARVRDADGQEHRRLAEPLTSYSVLRLKQGFWKNSAAGLMATATASDGMGTALTGGADLQLELLDGKYSLALQTHFSYLTQAGFSRQDEFTLAGLQEDGPFGYGGEVFLNKKSGEHWIWGLGGYWRSPSLALNDIGYLDRPDWAAGLAWLEWRRLKPLGPFDKMHVSANLFLIGNTSGINLGDGGNLSLKLFFSNNTSVGSTLAFTPESCDDRETRTAGRVLLCGIEPILRTSAWVWTDKRQPLAAGLDASYSTTDQGHKVVFSLPIQIHPSSWFQIKLTPSFQKSQGRIRWIDTQDTGGQERFLFSNQHSEFWNITLYSTWTFINQLSLQTYAQVLLASVDYGQKYEALLDNSNRIRLGELSLADSVPDDYDYSFGSFILGTVLRYEYLPGSVLYLVYTGAFDFSGSSAEFRFGNTLGDLLGQPARHVLMLKLSYYWG